MHTHFLKLLLNTIWKMFTVANLKMNMFHQAEWRTLFQTKKKISKEQMNKKHVVTAVLGLKCQQDAGDKDRQKAWTQMVEGLKIPAKSF